MRTSLTHAHLLSAVILLLMLAVTALAQPGTPLPASSELSAQKNGSVLIYNLYRPILRTFLRCEVKPLAGIVCFDLNKTKVNLRVDFGEIGNNKLSR